MLHISSNKLFQNGQTLSRFLSRAVLLHSKYFKVVQGHRGHVVCSVPADARSVSDSWLSCFGERATMCITKVQASEI